MNNKMLALFFLGVIIGYFWSSLSGLFRRALKGVLKAVEKIKRRK